MKLIIMALICLSYLIVLLVEPSPNLPIIFLPPLVPTLHRKHTTITVHWSFLLLLNILVNGEQL